MRIFQIGETAIYAQGDSTDPAVIDAVAEAARQIGIYDIEICITDPPYGVHLTKEKDRAKAHTNTLWKRFFRQQEIKNDCLQGEELISLWHKAIKQAQDVFFCNRLLMFFPQIKTLEVADTLSLLKFPLKSILVWVKDQAVIGWSEFCPQTEFIVYAGATDSRRRNKNRGISNVFCCPHSQIKSEIPWKHPSFKPLKLIRDLLDCTTIAEDCVYDPFAGCGSVAVACYRTGRKSINIEYTERFTFGALLRFRFETAGQMPIYEIKKDAEGRIIKEELSDESLKTQFDTAKKENK